MMKKALALFLCLTILVPVCPASADSEIPYKYDANGNLTSGDGKYFEYNDANKLVRVRLGDANGAVLAEYVYDHAGQRIKKIENGVTTYYVGKLYEEEYTAGQQTGKASYFFANGQRVAKKDNTGKMLYFHADHLGGTNVITDESGNQVERTKYYPFGDIREGGNERYSFTGKEKDKATDFYYFEARHYNPGYRHFTQADIIVPKFYDPQSLNRYAYVQNNPLKYIDPTGNDNIPPEDLQKYQKLLSGNAYYVNGKIYYFENGQLKEWTNSPPSQENSLAQRMSKESYGNADVFPEGLGVPLKGDNFYGEAHKFPSYSKKNLSLKWCTEYVAEKYQIPWSGHAKTWIKHADDLGYSTGDVPAINSIVVTNESKDYGHVAIVKDIIRDENGNALKIVLSESNYPGGGVHKEGREINVNSKSIRGYIYTEESRY